MIAKLKGIVDSSGEDWVVVDVNGVGYHVACSSRTLASLPGHGEAAMLAIETYVREDQIRLFGFASDAERNWFRALLTVQGVGTKVALAILSTLPPAELASAIALQDKAQIARAQGVGPRVAQRVVSELKGKAPEVAGLEPGALGLQRALGEGQAASNIADAVSALTNLGYSGQQASAAVARVVSGEGNDAPAEKLIRLGLKELSA